MLIGDMTFYIWILKFNSHISDTPNTHIHSGPASYHNHGLAAARPHQDIPIGVLRDPSRTGLPWDASNVATTEPARLVLTF